MKTFYIENGVPKIELLDFDARSNSALPSFRQGTILSASMPSFPITIEACKPFFDREIYDFVKIRNELKRDGVEFIAEKEYIQALGEIEKSALDAINAVSIAQVKKNNGSKSRAK